MGGRTRVNMNKIKIWFCDFWPLFEMKNNFLTNTLKKHYNIEFDKNKPDYIFYSNFGYHHLKYNCIKIFYTGENLFPNFNICDYAIGTHNLKLEKRYLQLPIYLIQNGQFIKLPERKKLDKEDLEKKKEFCNFIYSNKKGNSIRKEFFDELNKYKDIISAGKFLNNTGYATKNKLETQKQCKFTIAFENEKYPGYSTEKIIDAFIARTIPIYWGDEIIGNNINPKAFINCNTSKDIPNVIKQIKQIDKNDDLWLKIANEPIFLQKDFEINKEKELEKFLIEIIETKKQQVPKSLEARRVTEIIKKGSLFINIKHKIHKIKIEKGAKNYKK